MGEYRLAVSLFALLVLSILTSSLINASLTGGFIFDDLFEQFDEVLEKQKSISPVECQKTDLLYKCQNPPYASADACGSRGVENFVEKSYTSVKFNCCKQSNAGWDCYFEGTASIVKKDFLKSDTPVAQPKPWEQGGIVSPSLDVPWDQQQSSVQTSQPQCPSNSQLVNGGCLCNTGFLSQNGVCIPELLPEEKCKQIGGNFDVRTQKCVKCPPGLIYQSNGKCGCEKGLEFIGNQCVPSCNLPNFRNDRGQCNSCKEFCQSKGMTDQKVDHTAYIQDYLNKNGMCKQNVQIQGGKTLQVTGTNCVCSDPNLPQIQISGDVICRNTPCGDVPCMPPNNKKSCSCGAGCTMYVSCNWGGWKFQGGRFVPIIQAGNQQQN